MVATANEETKKLANNWICRVMDAVYINSEGVPTVFDFDDFQNAWRKKRSHLFFDKSLKVQFALPDNALNAWPQVEKNFERLRSSFVMHMVTGSSDQNTTAAKQSGGATSTISTSHLSLSRNLPKGIKSDTKPLTFKTDAICVHIFPAFVAIERDKQLRVSSLFNNQVTHNSKLMVGKAPRDSEVIDQSWKYVNVSGRNKGQPDKRRADNELLDNYKVGSLNLRIENNAEEVLEFIFSNEISSHLFYAAFLVYFAAIAADHLSELEGGLETQDLPDTANQIAPACVLETSGIVSSGEDITNNPTETDIKNRIEALFSLEDGDYAWVSLKGGDGSFIQSMREKGEMFCLEFYDGKKMMVAKINFHKEEILSIFSAFAKSEFSWKYKIEWGPLE